MGVRHVFLGDEHQFGTIVFRLVKSIDFSRSSVSVMPAMMQLMLPD
jgi:hypothetical protein